MPIYDISLTISPTMPVWPGEPPVRMIQAASMDDGAEYNATHLELSAHTGTHIDAPHHFMNDGRTIESLPLDLLTGPCYLIQLPDDIDEIDAATLDRLSLPTGVARILFGTRNSKLWAQGESRFREDFVSISEDGAKWLVARNVKLVGIDYLSVASYNDPIPTHQVLLGAGVIVLEGLDLSQVPRGFYDLYCLPLKLAGADGAPARAILVG